MRWPWGYRQRQGQFRFVDEDKNILLPFQEALRFGKIRCVQWLSLRIGNFWEAMLSDTLIDVATGTHGIRFGCGRVRIQPSAKCS
jgi:hypothetical protein